MTLARQLIAAVSALFLVALIGVEFIHLRSAQEHLQRQLDALAQDAATSLGLSIGTLMRSSDPALAETIVNPVFDRGHYEKIEFVSSSGEVYVSKSLRLREGRYPAWFADLFALDAPSAESMVSAGWRQLGKVRVKTHPVFAYEQLWETARSTLLYLVVIYALGLGVLHLILRGVLRPLHEVERAAQAISERNFVQIASRPRTREVERVVQAMNALSKKVQDAIALETARAEGFQREAFVDEVSDLLNRRGFEHFFEPAYGENGEAFGGAFAFVEIADLGAINATLGAARCDAMLRSVGSALQEAAGKEGEACRWGGALFALSIPALDPAGARGVLSTLRAKACGIVTEHGVTTDVAVSIGAAFGTGEDATLERLAASAQAALERARLASDSGVDVAVQQERAAGAEDPQMLRRVQDLLARNEVELYGQPALALPGRGLLHTELMARLPDGAGGVLPAAQFMPLVWQHGLARRFDEVVIERACAEAKRLAGGALAINLSPASVRDAGFSSWLVAHLGKVRPDKVRLVFEVSEYGVVQDEAHAAALAAALAKAGAGFAIDHFGVHRNSLALVQRLKPEYLKLAAVHTQGVLQDAGTRFFVDSVVRAARQLDVPTIAQNVESEEALAALNALGVVGFQGYLAGKPSRWPNAS